MRPAVTRQSSRLVAVRIRTAEIEAGALRVGMGGDVERVVEELHLDGPHHNLLDQTLGAPAGQNVVSNDGQDIVLTERRLLILRDNPDVDLVWFALRHRLSDARHLRQPTVAHDVAERLFAEFPRVLGLIPCPVPECRAKPVRDISGRVGPHNIVHRVMAHGHAAFGLTGRLSRLYRPWGGEYQIIVAEIT